MLPTEHLPAFALLAFVLIAVPGPSVMFVVTRSLTLGRRAGVATALGNAAGAYVQVVLVAVGVGAIVQESIAVFTVLKLAGALYLVYLGVQALRHRGSLAAALQRPSQRKLLRRMLTDAFVVEHQEPEGHHLLRRRAAAVGSPTAPAGSVPLQLLALGAHLLRDRRALRRRLGVRRGRRAHLARPLAAAPGGDRRHRRRRHDRPRRRPRGQRPQGLGRQIGAPQGAQASRAVDRVELCEVYEILGAAGSTLHGSHGCQRCDVDREVVDDDNRTSEFGVRGNAARRVQKMHLAVGCRYAQIDPSDEHLWDPGDRGIVQGLSREIVQRLREALSGRPRAVRDDVEIPRGAEQHLVRRDREAPE